MTHAKPPLELLMELERNPHLRVLDMLPALRSSIEALQAEREGALERVRALESIAKHFDMTLEIYRKNGVSLYLDDAEDGLPYELAKAKDWGKRSVQEYRDYLAARAEREGAT